MFDLRVMCLAGWIASIGPAWADSPKIFIFDVMSRPTYRAAYARMLQGERNLPAWMATPQAAARGTANPGEMQRIDGADREVFQFCEPHNCGGHNFIVSFDEFGQTAVGILAVDGQNRFFGHPTLSQRKALLNAVSEL